MTTNADPRTAVRRPRRPWRLLGAAIGLATVGCGGPEETSVDVLELLPVAWIRHEVAEVPIGDPDDRHWLRDGWGLAGKRGDDDSESFRWITGESATLELWLGELRDLEMVWSGWPLSFAGAPTQTIRVEANGEVVGSFDMVADWRVREYRVAWPASTQQRGFNTLRLVPSARHVPADVLGGSNDSRKLAAAWSSLRLEGDIEGGEPRVRERATQPTLVMPRNSRVELFLRPGRAMRFELDDLRVVGAPGATSNEAALRVAFLVDQAAEKHHDLAPGENHALRWPATAEPVRLALEARGSAGLQLVAPRLVLSGPSGVPEIESSRPAADAAASEAAEPWNVLVYLVDSLRADHLGCYGYDRPTSPELDRFAAEDAVRFDRVVAQASWTRAAVASLLTGLYPTAHGAVGREDRLADETPFLAEILADAGWATAGFITNGNVSATFGFDRGFGVYRHFVESDAVVEHHVLSDALNEHVFAWLDEHDPGRPFFLYVHASDPHYPYRPPEPWLERLAAEVADPSVGDLDAMRRLIRGGSPATGRLRRDLVDLYDAEIAFNDHHFGRLLDRLRAAGLYDRTLIVFLGDHGEEFLDHGGWGHGATLYEEQLRVPLVIKLPGSEQGGRVVAEPVRQIDIAATILDALGQQIPPTVQGRSRLAAMRGARPAGPVAPSFAELHLDGENADVIVDGRFKLILDGLGEHAELYDVVADEAERHDLVAERAALAGYLRAQLLTRRATSRVVGRQAADIDPELRSRLEALGYLE